MRSIKLRWLAATSLALLSIAPSEASKRPRYGGTLRVQLRTPSVSLDPREWKSGSPSSALNQKLGALVYDRLLTLDDYGRFEPALASEWTHDSSFRSWQFKLRPAVRFSDGSPLAVADVVASLEPRLPAPLQISANESAVTIRSPHSTPDLLEQLATGSYFVFRASPDGTLLGTGPFYVSESQPAVPYESNPSATRPARVRFAASETAWSGRPFLDAIEFTLGAPPLRELLDLEMGRADIVEIPPDLVQRAGKEGQRLWHSAPNTLLALRFDEAQPAAADDRLREALSLSLDRETMANVLLQRQADPAAALLPQWLTGYAFLFDGRINLERARQIRAALPANQAGPVDPLRLHVDAAGDLMKLLGERVAVNARQANLTVQVVPRASATATAGGISGSSAGNPASPAGLHLFAWHFETVCPRAELESLGRYLQLPQSAEGAQGVHDLESLYGQERRIASEHRIVPLVLLPEYVGLSGAVRNWMPAAWGEWRLADVWLERGEDQAALPAKAALPAGVPRKIPGRRP